MNLDTRSGHAALFGWAAVILTVVTYDVWAISTDHVTLSSGFWRLKQYRLGKLVIGVVWLVCSWHLLAGDYHPIKTRLSGKA